MSSAKGFAATASRSCALLYTHQQYLTPVSSGGFGPADGEYIGGTSSSGYSSDVGKMAQGEDSVQMRDELQRQRAGRRRGRIAAGVIALTLGGSMLLLPVMTASAAAPPTAYGGDAVGKTLYQVYNAVAQVDPSVPGSRAAAQVDPSASPPILLP